MKLWQETIVIPFTPSESVTLLCESHPRDDGEINMDIVGKEGARRLLNAKGCTPVHGLFALIHVQGEVIAHHRRKQDCIALSIQRLNEVVGADFIRKRVVEEEGVATLFFCDAFKQFVFDALAV